MAFTVGMAGRTMRKPTKLDPGWNWCVAHGPWQEMESPIHVCPGCTKRYDSEAELMHDVRLVVGQQPGQVVWRNQAGLERHGVDKLLEKIRKICVEGSTWGVLKLLDQSRKELRVTRSGLAPGASDLIGIVAPHGRFLAIELKSKSGKPTDDQKMFVALVRKMGGVAGIAYTCDEAWCLFQEAQMKVAAN